MRRTVLSAWRDHKNLGGSRALMRARNTFWDFSLLLKIELQTPRSSTKKNCLSAKEEESASIHHVREQTHKWLHWRTKISGIWKLILGFYDGRWCPDALNVPIVVYTHQSTPSTPFLLRSSFHLNHEHISRYVSGYMRSISVASLSLQLSRRCVGRGFLMLVPSSTKALRPWRNMDQMRNKLESILGLWLLMYWPRNL